MSADTNFAERRIRIGCGVALGNVVGTGPVTFYTAPLFIALLTREFGWSRTTFAAAALTSTIVQAAAYPLLGRAIDRYGFRRVTLPGVVVFGFAVMAMALNNGSSVLLFVLYALFGGTAAVQIPTSYSKVVAEWFDAQRGLVLGLAVGGGLGLGGALLPGLVGWAADEFGWRGAYVVLGLVVMAVGVTATAFLVSEPSRSRIDHTAGVVDSYGVPAAQARRSSTFWVATVALFLLAVSVASLLVHSLLLLGERGVPQRTALGFVTAIALSQIAGRFLSGLMQDLFDTPRIALPFLLAPLVGAIMVLFVDDNMPLLVTAGMLLGLGFGAETEIGAYLISRYFGVCSFGETYGLFMALFSIGTGFGPYASGALREFTGSYDVTLWTIIVALLVATILFTSLPPYRFAKRREGVDSKRGRRCSFLT